MEKFIRIDGGIGRCIAATGIIDEMSEKETVSVVTGFPFIFEGLENVDRVYPIGTPFLYEDHIAKGEYVEPEPYNESGYYRDDKHLATIFNKLLTGNDTFVQPKIVLSEAEQAEAKAFADHLRKETGKKIILYQPWGSTGGKLKPDTKPEDGDVLPDESYRSFGNAFARKLSEKLLEANYLPLMVKTNDQIGFKDCKTFDSNQLPVRKIIALIPYVDGVICCDSFLHHASAGLGSPVPTIVLWAGTNVKNLGYSEHTNIVSWKKCLYEPNRVPHDHSYYVNKNKGSNEFKFEIIEEILEVLNNGNNKKGMDKE